jgi:trigger factor
VTVKEVKAKQLPEIDDDLAADAAGFDTLAELRDDIATRLAEADQQAIDREFEQAVLDATVAGSEIEVPDDLVHARAHELWEQMLSSLARQGISKDAYLRIAGKEEEAIVHEAEPDAAQALRRDAVLAAIVQAEGIEPSDEELLEAVKPLAERDGTTPEKLLAELRKGDRLERLREDLATRQAIDLLVREAKPISVEQAKARQKLWTPGQDEPGKGTGRLWTPGAS